MGSARLTNWDHEDGWPPWLHQAGQRAPLAPDQPECRPSVIDMGRPTGPEQLQELVASRPVLRVVDNYDEQLSELFISRHAQLFKANLEVKRSSLKGYLDEHYGGQPAWRAGSWVYYPWNGSLVHILAADHFIRLRTLRNQVLISDQEQTRWAEFKVGCAGLSVGSNGAWAIAITGGSQRLKLADGAILSGSNLNRLRAGVADVGINKAVIMARQLYELNPYLKIDLWDRNLTPSNLGEFCSRKWQVDLLVDEIDDLEMKVRLRLEARHRRLPVIMVTEPGDSAMLDVERFDLDPSLPIFHGLAPGIEAVLEKGQLTQRQFVKYASRIIGLKNLPLRDQQAMLKVGSQIPSPPQLGSTAMLAGGVIAFAARQIATGAGLKSGRHIISLPDRLMTSATSWQHRFAHWRHTQAMLKALQSM